MMPDEYGHLYEQEERLIKAATHWQRKTITDEQMRDIRQEHHRRLCPSARCGSRAENQDITSF